MESKKKSPTKRKSVVKPKKKAVEVKNKGGRPKKYDKKLLGAVYKLALLGAKNTQIIESLSIAKDTFYDWMKTNKEFSDTLKKGREDADAAVADSLFRNAVGYSLTETDIRVVEGQIVRTQIKKNYPPNPTSGIFWLKNRQSQLWKDKQEVLNTGDMTVKIEQAPDISALTDDEKILWLAMQKKLRK